MSVPNSPLALESVTCQRREPGTGSALIQSQWRSCVAAAEPGLRRAVGQPAQSGRRNQHRFRRGTTREGNLVDSASVIVSATCIAASTPVALAGVRAYRLYGGLRLVNCPETMEEVIVKMRATRAMASALVGRKDVRLRSCSRWPEKQRCDQACLAQIAASPNGCRVRARPARSTKPHPAAWAP